MEYIYDDWERVELKKVLFLMMVDLAYDNLLLAGFLHYEKYIGTVQNMESMEYYF